MPVDHPQGTTILVLGILGLITCPILAVVAWVMGNGALREIDAAPGRYANRGNVAAGRICGIVGTCIYLAVIAFYLIIVVVILGAASTSSG
jgi:hypothetical protein